MEKDFLNEIKNHMEVLNHEQVGYLLNIHKSIDFSCHTVYNKCNQKNNRA